MGIAAVGIQTAAGDFTGYGVNAGDSRVGKDMIAKFGIICCLIITCRGRSGCKKMPGAIAAFKIFVV